MTVTVIEIAGRELPDAFWRNVLLNYKWKTDYIELKGLSFHDSIVYLN